MIDVLTLVSPNDVDYLPHLYRSLEPFLDKYEATWHIGLTGNVAPPVRFGVKWNINPHVINFENFSQARNQLMDFIYKPQDFTLWVDADEVLQGNWNLELETVADDVAGYFIPILSPNTTLTEPRTTKFSQLVRLFRSKYRYKNLVHENILIEIHADNGIVLKLNPADGYLAHFGYDLLPEQILRKIERNNALSFKELEQDPNNSMAYMYIARTYMIKGDWQTAWKYLTMGVACPVVEPAVRSEYDGFKATYCIQDSQFTQ